MPLAVENARDQALPPEAPDAARADLVGSAFGDLKRDALAAASTLTNLPGIDTFSRWTRTEDLLFKVRKNLFETLAFVARKPRA